MAHFFELPIARRLANDTPLLQAFGKRFYDYSLRRPAVARNFFDSCAIRANAVRYATSHTALTYSQSSAILRVIAEQCEENNSTYFTALFHALCRRSNYDSCTSHINSNADDFDETMDFINDHYNVMECSSCGDFFPSDDMSYSHENAICESCRERHYRWSEYEDTYIHRDYAVNAIDNFGNDVVVSYENDDFEEDEEAGIFYHRDYRRQDRVIRNYHSSKDNFSFIRDEWTTKHNRFFGVELEVESIDGDRQANAKAISDRVNDPKLLHRMFFENDGSLSHGFEMITQPMSLPAQRELFKFLEDKSLTRNLKSHNTTSCGLHVHVSRSNMTDLQIGKIVSFINDPRNEMFIRSVARRYASGFCQIKSKKVKDCRSGDRYEAVNLTNRNTIEFRLFRGSLKYEAVIAAVEFCNAIIEYTRPSVASLRDLTSPQFLSFCQSKLPEETKIFRKYFNSRMSGRIDMSDAA